MLKTIRFVDNLIDTIIIISTMLLLMLGVYMTLDANYIYKKADMKEMQKVQATADAVQEAIKTLTDDAVAWISIDGTNINYPIMHCDNNAKYLNTDPYGEYSLSGSIFLDARNSGDFSDPYMILYGHHMVDGRMFGELDKYEDNTFFADHRKGKLFIGDMEYSLNIFAFSVMDAMDDMIFDPTTDPFEVHAYITNESAIYYKPEGNPLLALSTCRDPGLTTRTVVFAEINE